MQQNSALSCLPTILVLDLPNLLDAYMIVYVHGERLHKCDYTAAVILICALVECELEVGR